MWDSWQFGFILLLVLEIGLATAVTIHAVMWKRDSRAVIGWVGLAWLAPIVGAFLYACLGVNRLHRKAVALNIPDSWDAERDDDWTEEDQQRRKGFETAHSNLVGLEQAGRWLTQHYPQPGNLVEPLIDGDQAYPAMLKAINEAEHSVALLSYIFDSDRAGDEFLEALTAAKKRGVEIRVLIDDVGSKYSRPNMVHRLRKAGLKVGSFLPTRVPRLQAYANLRNHRKILVVDGKVGFTGGTNIREGHWLGLKPKSPVKCLHFQLAGPVVAHLQEVFAQDWAFATGEILDGDSWFPVIARAGHVWARGIEHGPDEHFECMANVMAAALASSRQRVRILTPYFLPNASLIQALNVAAMRGVQVQVYLPSENNVALVQWACTAQLWQLLEKDIEIYYTVAPFDHTKLMIVDDVWTLIGSTNWDPRSLRLNFEFNVECYDTALAGRLNEIADQRAESAHRVTLEEVNSRNFSQRLRDGLARLMTPYL